MSSSKFIKIFSAIMALWAAAFYVDAHSADTSRAAVSGAKSTLKSPSAQVLYVPTDSIEEVLKRVREHMDEPYLRTKCLVLLTTIEAETMRELKIVRKFSGFDNAEFLDSLEEGSFSYKKLYCARLAAEQIRYWCEGSGMFKPPLTPDSATQQHIIVNIFDIVLRHVAWAKENGEGSSARRDYNAILSEREKLLK